MVTARRPTDVQRVSGKPEEATQVGLECIPVPTQLCASDPDRAPPCSSKGAVTPAIILERQRAGMRVATIELDREASLPVDAVDLAHLPTGDDRNVGLAQRHA